MHILTDHTACPARLKGAALAIGNFDGVHRGHQAVIAAAIDAARAAGAPAGVIVFEPHPRQFFQPDVPLFRLTPLPLKLKLFAALGLDLAVVLAFDADLAKLPAEIFTRTILVEGLRSAHIVSGYDFHFGKGRDGNPERLESFGREMGFAVTVVGPVGEPGAEPFSSSRIRAALRDGDPQGAAHMLGFWWRFSGTVIGGAGRGAGLGFPTANLALAPGMEIRHGIYAVRAHVDGARHPAAAYIGTRPTFGPGEVRAEIFLFDFDGDLYGRELEVELIAYLRGDAAFESEAALKSRMQEDVAQARGLLARIDADDPMRAYPLGRALANT